MANTLFLRLEGPLQSWGVRAQWKERDTAFEPTKSGVIGLLGCALGLRRDDDRLRELSDALRMGVRVDRAGTPLVDYHTTGGGFNQPPDRAGKPIYHDDPYMGGVLSPERSKEGRIKVKINENTKLPETDVSFRRYLMDASFLVALHGPDALITEGAAAVQHPRWPVFLGRKACIPTEPVFAGTGEYTSLEAALQAHPLPERVLNEAADQPLRLRLIIECAPGEGNARGDAIGVPARRLFWPRYVREHVETFGSSPASPKIDTIEG